MASEARFLAALLLALTCSHARVLAAPSPAERETARSLMQEGDRLREAGDDAEALVRFQSAHALMHVPTTGLALAQTQAKLGLLVEARGTAMEVLGMAAAPGEPAVFATARKAAAELAAELEPRVITLRTRVTPASASYTLQIDDITLPGAARAAPWKTNPGAHSVHVSAPGFEPQTRRLQLSPGATEELSFSLKPIAVPPAPPPLKAASAADPVDDPGAGGRTRGFIALGAGGVVLAAGLVLGGLSWAAAADEKKRCTSDGTCDPARADALQRANTFANVANVSVPLGLLGVAYGLYELLSAPAAPPPAAHAKRLQLELTTQGAVLRGVL